MSVLNQSTISNTKRGSINEDGSIKIKKGIFKVVTLEALLTNDVLNGKGAMSPYCILCYKDKKYVSKVDYFAGDEPQW